MIIRLHCCLHIRVQNVEVNGEHRPEDKHVPPAMSLADSQGSRPLVGKF